MVGFRYLAFVWLALILVEASCLANPRDERRERCDLLLEKTYRQIKTRDAKQTISNWNGKAHLFSIPADVLEASKDPKTPENKLKINTARVDIYMSESEYMDGISVLAQKLIDELKSVKAETLDLKKIHLKGEQLRLLMTAVRDQTNDALFQLDGKMPKTILRDEHYEKLFDPIYRLMVYPQVDDYEKLKK